MKLIATISSKSTNNNNYNQSNNSSNNNENCDIIQLSVNCLDFSSSSGGLFLSSSCCSNTSLSAIFGQHYHHHQPNLSDDVIIADSSDDNGNGSKYRCTINTIPNHWSSDQHQQQQQQKQHLVSNKKLGPIVQDKLDCLPKKTTTTTTSIVPKPTTTTTVAGKECCFRNKVPYHHFRQPRQQRLQLQQQQWKQRRCFNKVLLFVVYFHWLSFHIFILMLLFDYYYHYYFLYYPNSIANNNIFDLTSIDTIDEEITVNRRKIESNRNVIDTGFFNDAFERWKPSIDYSCSHLFDLSYQQSMIYYQPWKIVMYSIAIIIAASFFWRIFCTSSSSSSYTAPITVSVPRLHRKFRKINIFLMLSLILVYVFNSPSIAQNHHIEFHQNNAATDDTGGYQQDDFVVGNNNHDSAPQEDDDQTAYPSIRALLGKDVGLPCNISQSGNEGNAIKLILWYKNSILGSPIYSVDARGTTNITMAKHFLSNAYRDRAWFEMHLANRMALLFVKNLQHDDDGHYICRVDYRWTRTTISNVRLEVIVPPFMIKLEQIYRWVIPPMMMMMFVPTPPTNKDWNDNFNATTAANTNAVNSKIFNKGRKTMDLEMEKSFKQEFHYLLSSNTNDNNNKDSNTNTTGNNGTTMINDITIVRQPEESTLNFCCDSYGGKPMSMVKWFRLEQFENANLTNVQLIKLLQSTGEKNIQLIDDSYFSLTDGLDRIENFIKTLPPKLIQVVSEMMMNYYNKSINNINDKISIVRNELNIGKISMKNHGQLYLCRISNSNLTKSTDIIVKLEVYAGPKWVNIQQRLPTTTNGQWPPQNDNNNNDGAGWDVNTDGNIGLSFSSKNHENRTWHSIKLLDHYLQQHNNDDSNGNQHAMKSFRLRSGYEFDFTCHTNGSFPAAQIFWYLKEFHTNTLRNITDFSTSLYNGYDTLSYLKIVPQFTDNKANLICQAYNPVLHELTIQQQLQIQQQQNGSEAATTITLNSLTQSLSSEQETMLLKSKNQWHHASNNHNIIISNNNSSNIMNQYYLNSIIENIMAPKGQHQHQTSSSSNNNNYLPFQLFTSVQLDVNYKPIVSINVLSGEQMYEEVKAKQQQPRSNNNDNKNIVGNDANPNVSKIAKKEEKNKNPLFVNAQSHAQQHYYYYRFVEMEEIFFNCSINSNPEAHSTEWYCNEKLISIDIPKGIIITNKNRTLIFSPSTRRSSGIYHCVATNILGKAISDRVQIDILFKPQCQVEFVQTYYQHLGDYVQLKCHILANPSDGVKFSWSFNDSIFISDDVHFEDDFLFDHLNYESSDENFNREVGNNNRNGGNKWKKKPASSSSSSSVHSTITHQTIDHRHLITNVVRIHLKKWSSFGHFNCHARNSVGLQAEPCRWHIIPHHYHAHYRNNNNYDSSFMNMLPNQQQQHHHHRHYQSSSILVDPQQQQLTKSTLPNQLNNCHIIESSNAVVIKCSNGVEVYEKTLGEEKNHDHHFNEESSSSQLFNVEYDNHTANKIYNNNKNELLLRSPSGLITNQDRSYLTYHVQVFRLGNNSNSNNNPQNSNNNNEKSSKVLNNNIEQQYSHQKSGSKSIAANNNNNDHKNQPESKKQISSQQQQEPNNDSIKNPYNINDNNNDEPILVMETLNFTNPLFIITNLSASTSYLLRIWSSKMYLDDTMIEQVNITVRTKPEDSDLDKIDHDRQSKSSSSSQSGSNGIIFGKYKLDITIFMMISFIIFCFVLLTLTYAIVRIRLVLRFYKARRDMNSNDDHQPTETTSTTINVFEKALYEMRPDTLEKDLNKYNINNDSLKTNNNNGCGNNQYQTVLDTFKPYVNVENLCPATPPPPPFMIKECDPSSSSSPTLIIKCDHIAPEASIITYQNYLFPLPTTDSTSNTTIYSGDMNQVQQLQPTTTTESKTKICRVNCCSANDDDEVISSLRRRRMMNSNDGISSASVLLAKSDQQTTAMVGNNLQYSFESLPSPQPPLTTIVNNVNKLNADVADPNHHHHEQRHHSKTSSSSSSSTVTAVVAEPKTTYFCMNSETGCTDNAATRQFLLPKNSFQYPLSVRIVPEINEGTTTITTTTMTEAASTSMTTSIINARNSNLFDQLSSTSMRKEVLPSKLTYSNSDDHNDVEIVNNNSDKTQTSV